MNECIKEYLNLLIIQYRQLPNATAHIKAKIKPFGDICDLYKSFDKSFDIDFAEGKQLDIIGRIVGISRIVGNIIPKEYFSFADTPNGKTFGEGEFYRVGDSGYSSTELNDYWYRFFIKAKVIRNFTDGKLSGVAGMQKAMDYLFSGSSFLVDNLNMTNTIWVSDATNIDKIRYIKELGLLPIPQGVGINAVITFEEGNAFGFAENPNSRTFGNGKFSQVEVM